MRKAIIIMLALLVLNVVPAGYNFYIGWGGEWQPNKLITYCTPQYDVAFTSVSTGDNEVSSIDVAQTSASITDSGKTITVTINNAYPGYQGYVDFTIKNIGDGPIEITGFNITNPNTDCLELEITGEWQSAPVLQPDDTRNGHLVHVITDQAGQNTIYPFSISIQAEQYGDLQSPMSFGGFGGFSGEPIYYIDTNFFGIEDRYRISYDGVLLETIEFTSDDGTFTITIPNGTTLLDKEGKRLEILEVEFNNNPPPPPEDSYIIGLSYKFSPKGASFDQPFDLIVYYDLEKLPENISSVYIAYYDEEQGWIKLEYISGFIAEFGAVTAEVSHFTTFAIIGSIIPALTPPPEEEEEIVIQEEEEEELLPPREVAAVITPVKTINWLLIVITGSILFASSIIFLWYRRRRRSRTSRA